MLSTDPVDIKLVSFARGIFASLSDVNGDLYIGPLGLELVSGLDGVAQLIGIAIQLAAGEWFLNLKAGIPWDEILGEKFDEALLRKRIAEAIGRVPGVIGILSITVDFDPVARAVSTDWEVQVKFDDTEPDQLSGTTSVGGSS